MANISNIFVDLSQFTDIGKKIGKGAFGEVFCVVDQSGKEYAAKITSPNLVKKGSQQEKMMREVIILKSVHHPAILEYRGFNLYDFRKSPRPTILTEYMERGALDKMIEMENKKMAPGDWNSTKKQIILIGVASAMRYLHRRDIIHRDLKPANILLDANLYPRVCDFGLSKALDDNQSSLTMNLGTPFFMAPELFGDNAGGSYGKEIDVFAFAIMTYQLVTGLIPYADFFKGKRPTPFLLVSHVGSGGRPSFKNTSVSTEFQRFMEDCWASNPSDRKTFEQIYDELANNRDLVIDENVDSDEVASYVEKLEEIEETTSGKTILSVSQNSSSFELNQTDLRRSSVLSKSGNLNSDLPESREKKLEMLQDIKKRGFLVHPKDVTLQLLNEFSDEVVKDSQFFVSAVDFANMNNQQGNANAKKFLDSVFRAYTVPVNSVEIAAGKFRDNRKIQRVNVPPSVRKISDGAFDQCKSLSYANIPPSVEQLGAACFNGCRSLGIVNLNLNTEMKEIPQDAFKGCEDLTVVKLPNGLKKISKRAFENCTKLTEIDIPASVTLIENGAFKGCKNLNNARIHSKSTKYEKSAFGAWKKPKIVL